MAKAFYIEIPDSQFVLKIQSPLASNTGPHSHMTIMDKGCVKAAAFIFSKDFYYEIIKSKKKNKYLFNYCHVLQLLTCCHIYYRIKHVYLNISILTEPS